MAHSFFILPNRGTGHFRGSSRTSLAGLLNDILVLEISPETLNMVQTMAPAQRKKSKKTVNTLKLGVVRNLVLAFKIRSLNLSTVHILQLHSKVPQLLADLEFHTNLSHRGREKEADLRSRCEANTLVRISQHHFAFPAFKKCMPSGSLF